MRYTRSQEIRILDASVSPVLSVGIDTCFKFETVEVSGAWAG